MGNIPRYDADDADEYDPCPKCGKVGQIKVVAKDMVVYLENIIIDDLHNQVLYRCSNCQYLFERCCE